MVDKLIMITENLSKKSLNEVNHSKNCLQTALKCVKIHLLEIIPSCCTLNNAKATSQENYEQWNTLDRDNARDN